MHRAGIAACMFLSFAAAAHAGWLGDVVSGTGGNLADHVLRDVADRVYEGARGSVSRRVEARGGVSAEREEAPPRKTGIRPGDVSSGYDFVAGGRELFHDDFRNTDPGGFPARWTLRGPDTDSWKAPLEVARYGGRNWVRYRPSNEARDVRSSFYARLDAGSDLPDRFTVEFDAVLPPFDGKNRKPEYRVLLINHGSAYRSLDYEAPSSNVVRIGSCGASSGNTELPYERGDGRVHRVEIAVDGRSVKAYVDRELVVNDPAGIVRPVTVVGMELSYQTGPDVLPLMFTDFRLAAAGPVNGQTPSNTSRSGPARASLP